MYKKVLESVGSLKVSYIYIQKRDVFEEVKFETRIETNRWRHGAILALNHFLMLNYSNNSIYFSTAIGHALIHLKFSQDFILPPSKGSLCFELLYTCTSWNLWP